MAPGDARAKHVLHSEGLPDAVVGAIRGCGRAMRTREAFATLAASFGFDGLSYILVGCSPAQPRLVAHWTTAGTQWTERYAERAYHLVDPRVVLTRNRAVPVAWRTDLAPRKSRARSFLEDADGHEIRGGVAWSLYDTRVGRAVVAWDSRYRSGAAANTAPYRLSLGTLGLLAGFVHEALVAHCKDTPPAREDAQLTDRERACVALVARGMTSADVGAKLGITTRTANFHMGNVMAKLGAVSRSEAIARAVAANMVSIEA